MNLERTNLVKGSGETMDFHHDTRKAVEAAAVLLRLIPHKEMGCKRLLALLYLADRESLAKHGRPIVGGRLVAMKYGPIHDEVYNLIKGGHWDSQKWSGHFDNDAYRVVLSNDPGVSALSRHEVNLLNDISAAYSQKDDWDVADATHEFDEYTKTYVKNTSTTIPAEVIIEAVGRGTEKAEILQDSQERAFFDKLFAEAK